MCVDSWAAFYSFRKEREQRFREKKMPRSRNTKGWGLPGAAGLLDGFRDGQDEFVFERPAYHLHADGESVVRKAEGNGRAGKAGQIQPLRKPHGVAVARAGEIISLAVMKRGTRGNEREQNRRVLHLAQNLGAEKIPVRPGLHEFIEGN